MAFLCPVRIRRNKKKKENDKEPMPSMGRITGSASIETLVRVGIEKENGLSPDSKMVVLHDFTPCVDDELEVRRGCVVNVLYQENDWVYVIAEHNQQEGFIPHSYCATYGSHLGDLALNVKKKLPRGLPMPDAGGGGVSSPELEHNTTLGTNTSGGNAGLDNSDNDSYNGNKTSLPVVNPTKQSQNSVQSNNSSSPDVHPFFKEPGGRYIVLYTFIARDENDVSVERGEFVTVLNREDHDWYWIVRSDGQEGFVPSGFVYPADVIPDHLPPKTASGHNTFPPPGGGHSSHHLQQPADDVRFHGTELVMLYDYKAQAPDDLSVRRGDWIYADLTNQTVDGWLWAYAPKTRKYGFIPKAYARPPAMTSL